MLKVSSQRHLGMDIVRAFAILTVLIGHGLIFFPKFFQVDWLIYLAVFGVELFFALSGFLIGNILIGMSKESLDFSKVVQFWLKRWLRTIPVYLFIAFLIMLTQQKFYFSYLLFIQNFYPQQLQDFPISWSLSIEEWFYIGFPLLMFLIHKIMQTLKISNKSFVIQSSIALFILVPLFLRYLAVDSTEIWDNAIRKHIFLRPDGIAYGVLLAYIYDKNKQILVRHQHNIFQGLILALGFGGMWWLYNDKINIFSAQSSIFNNMIFYPLVNIYSAFFVGYFIRFRKYSDSRVQKSILFISLISYSVYLVHFPIYLWFSKYASTSIIAFLLLTIAITFMFIVGTILYKTIEKPFMDLRKKWTSPQVTTHL